MNTTLTHAVIAAPPVQQAPNFPGGAAAGGGTAVAGLLVAVWLAAKWKDHIKGEVRKYVIAAVIMTACLSYGTGVIAQTLGSIGSTAGTVTNTITNTTTGQ